MKPVKILMILFLAGLIVSGVFYASNSDNPDRDPAASRRNPQSEEIQQMCARLIRFGQIALDRGRCIEAKRFFQKAIMIDPAYAPAWRKYNMALIAVISEKVEMEPELIGDVMPDSDSSPSPSVSQSVSSASSSDDSCD